MVSIYPVLIQEMKNRKITQLAMAQQLGISYKSLYNKLSGAVEFTWGEVCKINACFFPDIKDKDYLFAKADISEKGGAA